MIPTSLGDALLVPPFNIPVICILAAIFVVLMILAVHDA